MQVRLKVLKGSKAGQEINLPMPLCLVGRGKECHLRSGQAAVSQRHCVISARGDEVVICDLQSLNGTYVNGTKVTEEIVLHCGDQLRIGPLAFEVFIQLPPKSQSQTSDSEVLSIGTAGGNANLSTMIVRGSRGSGTAHLTPDSEIDLLADENTPTLNEPIELEPGQSVIVCGGILEGAVGTVVKLVADGRYLVALGEQNGQVLVKIPALLLRPA